MTPSFSRTMLYAVVSVSMFAGYLWILLWYTAKKERFGPKKRKQRVEHYAGPAQEGHSDADVNANIIRAFNSVIKRFPTPSELRETRERVKELLGDNVGGRLSDMVIDYVTDKFGPTKKDAPPAAAPPVRDEVAAPPAPNDSRISSEAAPFPPQEQQQKRGEDGDKVARLLQTVQTLTKRLEGIERERESLDDLSSALDALTARMNSLSPSRPALKKS